MMEGKPPPPNPAMPYRDDCWSEGATSALIDAWGDRFVELNKGNLRQKDWQEVADAVNSRRGGERRPPRTDSQCKNRIDTLKKKYKAERFRIGGSGGSGGSGSQWPFYSRLESLIGSSSPAAATVAKKPPSSAAASPPFALPLPSHRKVTPLPAARPVEPFKRPAIDNTFFGKSYSAAAAAAAAAAEGDSASSASSSKERSRSSLERERERERLRPVKRWRGKREGEGGEDGIRQLAQAVVRFAGIYEKVEVEKQQQMMEMEKQRLEFAKGLEFRRMQAFLDSQVQIEKIRRSRRDDDDSYV